MLRTDNEKRQNKIRRRRHRPTIMWDIRFKYCSRIFSIWLSTSLTAL
jgi:hypothetical protein